MPPTSDLNATGQFFEEQFKQAWKLFREKSFEQANNLSLWQIQEPKISNLHKAGLHLILAHSSDQYVYHAMEALRLYQKLYDVNNPDDQPTKKQRLSWENLIKAAEDVLKTALADEKEVEEANESYEFSQEELDRQIQEAADYMDAIEAELEAEGVSGQEEVGEVLGRDVAMQVDEPGGRQAEDEGVLEEETELSQPLPSLPTPRPTREEML